MSTARRRVSLVLALCMLLAASGLSSCATSVTQDKRMLQYLNQEGFGKRYAGNAQEQNYVTIGDTILFLDSFHPEEIRGSAEVDIDGTILVPEAGSVFVAGMTRSELESFLSQKLSPYYVQTDVKVEIRTGGSRAYYVWGEVDSPGRKAFTGDITIFEAVLAAAPTEHTSNLGRVRLIRADPTNPMVVPVNVADMWRTGDSTYNLSLQEYDIIYVPPTLLKQFADVVSGIVIPLTTPFQAIIRSILLLDGRGNFRNQNRF